jgi:elongation factor P
MISTSQFKNGLAVEVDGQPFVILEFQHVKPGKGGAFVRTKLKNIKTGAALEKTFRAGEKLEEAHLERRQAQYLYSSADEYNFMDSSTYDQMTLSKELLGSAVDYLKENMEVTILKLKGQSFGVELPNTVELTVTNTDPGIKGDTVTGGSKPATLETGLNVSVPLFMNEGDVVRVDTRNGQYITRVS